MAQPLKMHRSILVLTVTGAGAVLTALQNTTLERLKAALIADPASGSYQSGLLQRVWAALPALQTADWLLVAMLFAAALTLLVAELRGGRVASELEEILAGERDTLILLAIFSAVACRFYLAPGEFALGDSEAHVTRVWTAARSLSGGAWPSWSFLTYAGFPLLQFYGSIFFVVTGAAVAIIGNLLWTTKGVLFLLHAGSAFPMYAWARTTGLERRGAMIASLAYVLSFLHTHTVVWTGALPVAMVYFLFPAALWALERAFTSPSRRWVLLLGGSVAALINTHHGYAAFALELIAVYVVARLLLARSVRPAPFRLIPIALALLGALLLCGGPIARVFLEGSWVHLSAGFPLALPAMPNLPFLKDILVWRNTWTGWTTAYIGISVVVFACVGTAFAFARNPGADSLVRRSVAMVAVFALLCAAGTGRMVNLALPWLALAAGGVALAATRRHSPRFFLLLLAVLFLDLGPTTIQSPYRTDRGWLKSGLREVARRVEPHRTLVAFQSGVGTHYFHWGAYGDTDLIVPTGFFPQGAPQSLASINALVDAMNTDRVAATTRDDLLFLWDVGALTMHSRDAFTTAPGTIPGTHGAPFARVEPASPLVFSPRAVVAADDSLYLLQHAHLELGHTASEADRSAYLAAILPWVKAMAIDRGRASARAILLADDAPRTSEPPAPVIADPAAIAYDVADSALTSLQITRYEVGLRKVTIGCRTPAPGYLRAAFSWYPSLRVTVDGEPVTPLRSLLGAIVIPAQAGEHTIVLAPATPWRIRSLLSALAGCLLITASAILVRRHRVP
jgi:hypothetical protein